jgi:hypothetical protein
MSETVIKDAQNNLLKVNDKIWYVSNDKLLIGYIVDIDLSRSLLLISVKSGGTKYIDIDSYKDIPKCDSILGAGLV